MNEARSLSSEYSWQEQQREHLRRRVASTSLVDDHSDDDEAEEDRRPLHHHGRHRSTGGSDVVRKQPPSVTGRLPPRGSAPFSALSLDPTPARRKPVSRWTTLDPPGVVESDQEDEGLVLDSASRASSSVMSDPSDGRPSLGHVASSAVKQIFFRKPQTTMDTSSSSVSQAPAEDDPRESAASFARVAPKAGYLSKMGQNIASYKRRFFVLKPSTHLYYFVSPHDVEPRGCIDLDAGHFSVHELETTPDGRFRFQVVVQQAETGQEERIVLEARSEEVGREWMDSLTVERLSHSKSAVEALERERSEWQARISQLEQQVHDLHLVEKDRDGAIQDARDWRTKFENLDEAVRLLTRQVSRPPETEPPILPTQLQSKLKSSSKNEEEKNSACMEDAQEIVEDETKADETSDDEKPSEVENDSTVEETKSEEDDRSVELGDQSSFVSLGEVERQMDALHLEDTHFSALSNACQRLRDNLRLTSIEANTAVKDLTVAHEQFSAMEHKMVKAERELCKLWEENCSMREQLKKKKRERRVLVRELKSLLDVAAKEKQQQEQQIVAVAAPTSTAPALEEGQENGLVQQRRPASNNVSEEQRLILELEEHVLSSLRLHEKFLAASGAGSKSRPSSRNSNPIGSKKQQQPPRPPMIRTTPAKQEASSSAAVSPIPVPSADRDPADPAKQKWIQTERNMLDDDNSIEADTSSRLSPLLPTRIASLADDDDEDASGTENEDSNQTFAETTARFDVTEQSTRHDMEQEPSSNPDVAPSSNDLNRITYTQTVPLRLNDKVISPDRSQSSVDDFPKNRHPILKLNDLSDDEGSSNHVPPNLCASSTQSESSKSIVTDNAPTSRLACPLVDVVQTRTNGAVATPSQDDSSRKVYHLTFYAKKIGLQFQKIPAPAPSTCILSEAMTTDVSMDSTTEELKLIADISRRSNNTPQSKIEREMTLQVATPVDAVLVCGFHGFDDSTSNVRPKLGARLVAFDGVSVEVGRWTFESVRKAIHARGRPLTLSFRNDFLTTKQRGILTRAVAEVEAAVPPPRPTIQYRMSHMSTPQQQQQQQHHLRTFSMKSSSYDSEQSDRDRYGGSSSVHDSSPAARVVSVSNGNNNKYSRKRLDFNDQDDDASSVGNGSPSYQRRGRGSFRSFSDAGSSASALSGSLIGPLVSSLMAGMNDRTDTTGGRTPSFVRTRQTPNSKGSISQHDDFQASLL